MIAATLHHGLTVSTGAATWLPWVATSQLNGIFGLMEFDPKLFADLAAARP